jgi:hypothetical protein
MSTVALLMQSRKFWIGTIAALCAIIGAAGLLAGKITPAGYAVFVSGTAGPAIALIMGVAWEDSASKGAPPPASPTTTTINKGDQS